MTTQGWTGHILRSRRPIARAGAWTAAGCAILALGGAVDSPFGEVGIEDPVTRWALGAVAAGVAVPSALIGFGIWPRGKRREPPTIAPDLGRFIDRPERATLENSVRTAPVSSLTGPTGAGKSRLARELFMRLRATPQFSDGAWYFDLVNVAGADVEDQLVRATQSSESSGANALDILAKWIGDRRFLLVLDNCDGAADGVSRVVTQLAAACPHLKVVVTSQGAIVPIADTIEVRGLPLPPPGADTAEAIERYGSVALLLAVGGRWHLNDRNAPLIVSICRRLDGLPGALRLAAGQLEHQSVHELDAALGAMAFPPSLLEGMLNLSHSRLDGPQRVLFRRLSVFDGSFTVATARAVCRPEMDPSLVDEHFYSLVDRRLVLRVRDVDSPPPVPQDVAYFRLPGAFRSYGNQRVLEEEGVDAREALRRRHASHLLGLVEAAESGLTSRTRSATLLTLSAEAADIDAALNWAEAVDPEISTRMAASLFWFWNFRAELREAERRLARAISVASDVDEVVAARLHYGRGGVAFLQGDLALARDHLVTSVEIWDRHPQDVLGRGLALLLLGKVQLERGELGESEVHGESAVRTLDQPGLEWAFALALNDRADWFAAKSDWKGARALYERSLALWLSLEDRWGESLVRGNIGAMAWRADVFSASDHVEAEKHVTIALSLQETDGDLWGSAWSRRMLAELALSEGRLDEAEAQFAASLALNYRIGRIQLVAECIGGLGRVAVEQNQAVRGAALLAIAERLRAVAGVALWPQEAALHDRALEKVRQALGESALEHAMYAGRVTVASSSDGRVALDRVMDFARSASGPVPS